VVKISRQNPKQLLLERFSKQDLEERARLFLLRPDQHHKEEEIHWDVLQERGLWDFLKMVYRVGEEDGGR
jgi:hypothetical protein